MKPPSALLPCAFFVVAIPITCLAQQGSTAQGALQTAHRKSLHEPKAADLVPSLDLQFKQNDPIQGIPASPLIATPVPCSGGHALVEIMVPPEFRQFAIYFVEPSGARQIPFAGIPELVTPTLSDFAVTASRIALLIDAERKPSDPPKEGGQFIAVFSTDGQFKSTTELSPRGQFVRFGLLPSGDLVTLEFVSPNGTARLRLRDADGSLKSEISLPAELSDLALPAAVPESNIPKVARESLDATRALGRARFTAFGEKLLLWMPGKSTVTEIGEGGSARQVRVAKLDGYQLDAMIPANDRWIVRFRRSGLPESSADLRPETNNILVYEVSPSDGSLRRKLNFGHVGPWLACERDGTVTTFKADDQNQHLFALTADIGR